MSSNQILHLLIILSFAVSVNIPLGYLRETSRKYSLYWFILIHLSIPFIVLVRSHYGFSWRWIPLTLSCAILGQLIGGRIRRRKLS